MVNRSGIILAAGQGSRMRSPIPKPLVNFAGKPMVRWAYDTLSPFCNEMIVVIQDGHKELFSACIPDAKYVVKAEQLGTADALKVATVVANGDELIVMCADSPCVDGHMMEALCQTTDMSLLAFEADDPKAYGRLWDHRIWESCHDKNVPDSALCNAGIYKLEKTFITRFLAGLEKDQSGEFLLTDWYHAALEQGHKIDVVKAPEWRCSGVNTLRQKADLEKILYRQLAYQLMDSGVEICDPESIVIKGHLEASPGVTIESQCCFTGHVILAKGVVIQQGCQITDTTLGEDTLVKPFSTVTASSIGQRVTLGPYAHIQSSSLGDNCYLGNYVECKRTTVGEHVKAKHFSYIGDGVVGNFVNIGAGCVFCNYNGKTKSQTTVGDYSFVGANTSLIAPLQLGHHCLVGAGSVVDQNVESYYLALERSKLRLRLVRHKAAQGS